MKISRNGIFYICLMLIGVGFSLALSFSSLGLKVRSQFQDPSLKKIGAVTGAINPRGPWVEATKWVQGQDLSVRVYLSHFDEEERFEPQMQEINLSKGFDAHTLINHSLTNIAFANIDRDEWQELVIPYYEGDLLPRLIIYKYDPLIRRFIRMNDRD